MGNYKVCKKCGEFLPNTGEYFKNNKSCNDGKSNICRICSYMFIETRRRRNQKLNTDKVYDSNIKKCCNKCMIEYPATSEYFGVVSHTKTGLNTICRQCINVYNAILKSENEEKYRNKGIEYRIKNRNEILEKKRKYYKKNKEKINNDKKEYYKSLIRYESSAFKKIMAYEEYRQDPNNLELGQTKCAYCKQWVNPTVSEVYERLKAINGYGTEGQESRIYCNNYCKISCPIYGKILNESDLKNNTSREVIPLVRYMALERDNYKCQRCDATTKDAEIHVHHILGYTQNKMFTQDIDNLICLCKFHHNEIHKKEGCKYHQMKCN